MFPIDAISAPSLLCLKGKTFGTSPVGLGLFIIGIELFTWGLLPGRTLGHSKKNPPELFLLDYYYILPQLTSSQGACLPTNEVQVNTSRGIEFYLHVFEKGSKGLVVQWLSSTQGSIILKL